MPEAKQGENIPLMTVERFFRPGACFHMQISTDFPDYVGIPHRHEYIEVVYVISGTATHTVEDKSYTVKRGDLCFINVNTVHMFCENRKSPEPLVVYDLMFTPQFFDRALTRGHGLEALGDSYLFRALPKGQPGKDASFEVSENLHSKFSELFNRMYDEYRSRSSGYMEIIRAYLLLVVVTAMRMHAAADRQNTGRSKEQLAQKVMGYIEENYRRPITVQDLAESLYLTPDYLGRVFKEVTGQTISAQIQSVRIRNACRLLISTSRTVTDIAAACGFGDAKNFYSVFKKYMGMPPGDYRRKNMLEE